MNDLLDILEKTNKIYIFGAASRAKTIKGYMNMLFSGLEIVGYLVDDEEENDSQIAGAPVIHLGRASEEEMASLQTKAPVIIATKGIFHERIEALLVSLGFECIIPVSVDVDNCLRNAYVRKAFAKEGREFVKLEDLVSKRSEHAVANHIFQSGIGEKPNACIYMAKSIYDKELETPYTIPPYEKAIQVGAALTDQWLGDDILTDDTGENISAKNRQYCETTGMYWVWKNCRHDYVGFSHYRRHFVLVEDWADRMQQHDIDAVVPVPTYLYPSVRENYKERHLPEDWEFFMKYLKENETEAYHKAVEIFDGNLFLPGNMFIAKWEVFDEFCRWSFPILDAIGANGGYKEDGYLNRYVAFISERLVTLFFALHENKYKIVYADRRFLR